MTIVIYIYCVEYKLKLQTKYICLIVVSTFLSISVLLRDSISPHVNLNVLCSLTETGKKTFCSSSALSVVSKSLPKLGYGW